MCCLCGNILMCDLYEHICKRFHFYEEKYPGNYDDPKSINNKRYFKRQIELDHTLSAISDFLKDKQTVAVDKTPVLPCDTIDGVNTCLSYKHDHKNAICGLTENNISATVYVSEKTQTKLLYLELTNAHMHHYRCFLVFCRPNCKPVYYSMWAYRRYCNGFCCTGSSACETSMKKSSRQYIADPIEQHFCIPEKYYFPNMWAFLEEHQLDSIQHNCNDAYEKLWASNNKN